jgi:hypothetical protein
MTLRLAPIFACLTTGIAVLCISTPTPLMAQVTAQMTAQRVELDPVSLLGTVTLVANTELPDAPKPQLVETAITSDALEADEQQDASSTTGTSSAQTSSAQAKPDAGKPATQDPNKPQDQDKSQHDTAEEQLKQQQKQRVLGIVPNFNTSYIYGAASLTAGQKFRLAFRSQIDPAAFGIAGFVALIEQAEGSHYAYGGGWGGYAKRYGQTYADSFDGQMIGNAILPALLHQDPRYFRLGRGSVKRRVLYALGTNVIAHHDGNGRWEPNYSNVLGNFAAGGISNLYLPENERGFGSTITGGLVVIAEGGVGSMFQEFWPDIARHFLHKDPTNGQDAINASKPDPTAGEPLFHNPPKHPAPTQ